MKDKLGQPITVGCFIAYGHALGRCAGLRIGKVLSLKEASPEAKPFRPDSRITIIGIADDFQDPELLSKASTLMFPDRVVVLPDQAIPPQYLDLLNSYAGAPR